MPLVEVLPNTAAASAPGWAYVPDTGLDPVKAGHVPQNPRKRTGGRPAGANAAADRTARQLAALQKRLTELDRDNARDVNIPVPKRAGDKEGGGRVPKGKTPATRRILMAQKTFANYLADEEAWAAQQTTQGDSVMEIAVPIKAPSPPPSAAAGTSKVTKERGAVAKRRASAAVKGSTAGASSSPPRPGTAGSAAGSAVSKDAESAPASTGASALNATAPASTPSVPGVGSTGSHARPPLPPPGAHPLPSAAPTLTAAAAPTSTSTSAGASAPTLPPFAPSLQHLLETATPPAPSAALLHALTHAPPLAFQAARTRPPSPRAAPPRRFCLLCGRFGSNRCPACGEGTCGLECAKAHSETCAYGRVTGRR